MNIRTLSIALLALLATACKHSSEAAPQTDATAEHEVVAADDSQQRQAIMRVPMETDMGEFFAGTEPKSKRLLLENIGTDTLRIYKVMPDCDCTEASVADTLVAPGHNTTLTVSLDLSEYVPAVIRKEILLFTSNANNQYVRVALIGTRK